ncbi:MAG: thiol-disulfide oxidoreductase DCC family protein [Candidatus Binatia bacterium]
MDEVSWKAAWTGGQYSLVRATAAALVFFLLLEATFAAGAFWYLPASMAVAAVALGLGAGGRPLAALFATLLPFAGIAPEHSGVVLLTTAWLLLHLALPASPYASLPAWGRADPAGPWAMPGWYPFLWQAYFVITRLGLALGAFAEGQAGLAAMFVSGAALTFLPTTAVAGWTISLAAQVSLSLSGNGSMAAAGLLHLLTFQPAWLARRRDEGTATVFYDGSCALCHAAVRFLLSEDRNPPRFRIAPLGESVWLDTVPERVRVSRPDSVVVVRGDEVLMRGSAVIAILEALGGWWRMVGSFLRLAPRSAVDAAYDAVAARRYRWFGRKAESCPLMPAALAGRVER